MQTQDIVAGRHCDPSRVYPSSGIQSCYKLHITHVDTNPLIILHLEAVKINTIVLSCHTYMQLNENAIRCISLTHCVTKLKFTCNGACVTLWTINIYQRFKHMLTILIDCFNWLHFSWLFKIIKSNFHIIISVDNEYL